MEDKYDSLMRPLFKEMGDEGLSPGQHPSTADDKSAVHAQIISGIYNEMVSALQQQLMGHVHVQPHGFFENLIIDVVLAMGYAGRSRDLARHLGRSGDGGVDGIVKLDELGLDAIYLQAKRLKPSSNVSASAVRDFIGSLETHKANKGIFVTTGVFTAAGREATELAQKRVVLIDGSKLTKLMVRYSIGTRLVSTFQFKEIDLSYFSQLSRTNNKPMASHFTRRELQDV
ncbi:MAG: restriction endonuclease [Aestuariivirga sp.]